MLYEIARSMNEEAAYRCRMKIGQRLNHPDGRLVEIVDGSFLGDFGRVSNFWYWKEVMKDGSFGPIECGYGWC